MKQNLKINPLQNFYAKILFQLSCNHMVLSDN